MERSKVLILNSLMLFCVSSALFLFTSLPLWALLTLLILFGGFSFTLYPLSITHCCDFFSAAGITAITCACLVIYGIGCIIGPLIAPLSMAATQPSGLFLYTATLSLLLTFYGIYRRRRVLPPAPKEPFVPLPTTTPTSGNLNPRIDSEKKSSN
jgi:MFS family permease